MFSKLVLILTIVIHICSCGSDYTLIVMKKFPNFQKYEIINHKGTNVKNLNSKEKGRKIVKELKNNLKESQKLISTLNIEPSLIQSFWF
jgi:hypothetical protein